MALRRRPDHGPCQAWNQWDVNTQDTIPYLEMLQSPFVSPSLGVPAALSQPVKCLCPKTLPEEP